MKTHWITACALTVALAGCTSDDLAAFSEGLAEASYNAPYYPPAATSYSPYAPYAFSTYSGWPSAYAYGQYLGPWGCSNTGAFYTCDSDGDGYADMYGNTDDGSYSSSSLRVNGRGEAYAWDSDCACWERERSLDGARRDYHDRYDDYDDYDDDSRHDRHHDHDD